MARRASRERFEAPRGAGGLNPVCDFGRGLWMSGAVSCKMVPSRGTLICFISVSRLFRSISIDFRDRFDRAAVFTKIVI